MIKTRYHRFVAIVFAAGLLAVTGGVQSARAADSKGMFAVHGAGGLHCGDVTAALLRGDVSIRPSLASWLLGYLSAMNRLQPDTYDVTPVQAPEAIINLVVAVCQQNASMAVETAAYSAFRDLSSAGLSAESPEVQVSANGQTTTLRKDTLIALQKYLIGEKLLHGEADGSFGAPTQAALAEFQKKQNLPQTALPDPATIVRALVQIPAQAKAAPPKK